MTEIRDPFKLRIHNRTLIYNFFVENPCSTKQDAAKALNISAPTVGKHAQFIRDGWRPEPEPEAAPVGNEFFAS